MDPIDPNGIQEVRKIIESSTSKVSLRDLEKKGFRKVKVLRSNDIDELIRRAVTAVVAREGADGDRVSAEIVEKSRQELKTLMAATQASEHERAALVERNAALEAEVRALRERAVSDKGAVDARGRELERRVAEAEELRRRDLADRESELASLRRRLEESEERALQSRARAKEAAEAEEKLGKVREELEQLRFRARQLETERRLVEELEVPKLRERIRELEEELRVMKAAAAAAPAAGVTDERMRAMLRDVLHEVGAGGLDGGALKSELAKIQRTIAESLARAGGRGDQVTEADLHAAKVSIEALFRHDAGPALESNIGEVKVKEKMTTSDLQSKRDKLRSLRKGGTTE